MNFGVQFSNQLENYERSSVGILLPLYYIFNFLYSLFHWLSNIFCMSIHVFFIYLLIQGF